MVQKILKRNSQNIITASSEAIESTIRICQISLKLQKVRGIIIVVKDLKEHSNKFQKLLKKLLMIISRELKKAWKEVNGKKFKRMNQQKQKKNILPISANNQNMGIFILHRVKKIQLLKQKDLIQQLNLQRKVKNYNIIVPKKPAALVDKFLCPQNNEIIFKVTKMPKSWMFFDSSTIYVGACIPEIAENYQYLNLTAPTHGGYFISSAGRCFHTKLP